MRPAPSQGGHRPGEARTGDPARAEAGAAPAAARRRPARAPAAWPAHLAEEAPTLLWASDAEGRLVHANRRFQSVFGLPAGALREDAWQRLLEPEALVRFRAELAAAIAVRGPFRIEVPLRTAGGARHWYRWEAAPSLGPDGALLGHAGCCTDLSEAREAEAALRELNATLERRIAERTAQLAAEAAARSAAQDRLRHAQKLEALGQLAGGVAHDFNNVSAAVLAGIALLGQRHGQALAGAAPGTARLLAELREVAERGAAISRRMLAFARREELRAAEIDPTELLRNLQAILANAIGPVVRVALDVPAALPALRADRAQLETTLINLAVNARDAMPGGGTVTLGAAVAEAGADPAGLAPGRYVRLWVADTGTGMEPAVLSRATEPFFTTKPRDRGTGLGLSMADGFAAQSGGQLRIESRPGLGTTVSLWLPCAAGQRPALAGGEARGRALIVDDQPMMRRFLTECLGREGWEVAEAEDGGQALLHLESGAPCDLLISDLAMPGMDGTALIQTARLRRPGLVAMLLTGTGRMAELAPLAERGGYALLRKPVSPAELAACLAGLALPGGAAGCGGWRSDLNAGPL
ncbi:hybrid sensor histidine kinase/response regulator [Roseicella aerolata]|uniref:histidine kinase n=1 Tax=Roseicella aerolata TaxID=2883479 RepID=A0A9X1IH34_9PROT|nr:response regulator [Roseicella aerolata]MCB4824524.1 response regulator [Roseicella aerolata]